MPNSSKQSPPQFNHTDRIKLPSYIKKYQNISPQSRSIYAGRFIVIEGIDGSGSSTLTEKLTERFACNGLSVVRTREPGGTLFAEKVRELILNPDLTIDAVTETLMYAAARANHVAELIRPSLRQGRVVVSDRFIYSSIAYQGFARGIGSELVSNINSCAIVGCRPEVVFILDLPVQVAIKRCVKRDQPSDRIENEGESFMRRAAMGYKRIAESNDVPTVILNACKPVDLLCKIVWAYLKDITTTA